MKNHSFRNNSETILLDIALYYGQIHRIISYAAMEISMQKIMVLVLFAIVRGSLFGAG